MLPGKMTEYVRQDEEFTAESGRRMTFSQLPWKNGSQLSTMVVGQPVLFPTLAIPIKGKIQGFFLCNQRNIVAWYDQRQLNLFDLIAQKHYTHIFQKNMLVRQLKDYICIVIEKDIVYFFEHPSRYWSTCFKNLKPSLFSVSGHSLFVTNKNPSKQSKFNFWPFKCSPERQQQTAKTSQQIYVYEHFHLKKHILHADDKIVIDGKQIEALTSTDTALFVYLSGQLVMLTLKKRQIVLRFNIELVSVTPMLYLHSVNRVNLITLSSNGSLSIVNIDRLGGVYGVEVTELEKQGVDDFSESPDGTIFITKGNRLGQYNIFKKKMLEEVDIMPNSKYLKKAKLAQFSMLILKETEFGQALQTRHIPDIMGHN